MTFCNPYKLYKLFTHSQPLGEWGTFSQELTPYTTICTANLPIKKPSLAICATLSLLPLFVILLHQRVISLYLMLVHPEREYAKPSDCNELEYLNDTSSDQHDWDCVSCPIGASCSGAINWTGVQAKFGWSRCHNNEAAFAQCIFPAACLGGKNPALMGKYHLHQDNVKIDLAECKSSDNCTAQCNTAYANNSVLCGQCAYDYSHDGLTGRCDRCPPLGENIGVAIVGGVLGIVCLIGYIMITLSDGGRLDESDGAKVIGLNFIQLISLLVTFPIAW